MLYYPNTLVEDIIGTKNVKTFALTPATLTAAYTANTKTITTSGKSVLVLDIKYVTGAGETGTTLDVQVQDSPDRVNFFTLTNEAASAGTSTLTARTFALAGGVAAATFAISYRLDITYKFMKISVQEAGVVTNFGNIYVGAQVAGN